MSPEKDAFGHVENERRAEFLSLILGVPAQYLRWPSVSELGRASSRAQCLAASKRRCRASVAALAMAHSLGDFCSYDSMCFWISPFVSVRSAHEREALAPAPSLPSRSTPLAAVQRKSPRQPPAVQRRPPSQP